MVADRTKEGRELKPRWKAAHSGMDRVPTPKPRTAQHSTADAFFFPALPPILWQCVQCCIVKTHRGERGEKSWIRNAEKEAESHLKCFKMILFFLIHTLADGLVEASRVTQDWLWRMETSAPFMRARLGPTWAVLWGKISRFVARNKRAD